MSSYGDFLSLRSTRSKNLTCLPFINSFYIIIQIITVIERDENLGVPKDFLDEEFIHSGSLADFLWLSFWYHVDEHINREMDKIIL